MRPRGCWEGEAPAEPGVVRGSPGGSPSREVRADAGRARLLPSLGWCVARREARPPGKSARMLGGRGSCRAWGGRGSPGGSPSREVRADVGRARLLSSLGWCVARREARPPGIEIRPLQIEGFHEFTKEAGSRRAGRSVASHNRFRHCLHEGPPAVAGHPGESCRSARYLAGSHSLGRGALRPDAGPLAPVRRPRPIGTPPG